MNGWGRPRKCRENMFGKRYGGLVVLGYAATKRGQPLLRCKCVHCERTITKGASLLESCALKSCGCKRTARRVSAVGKRFGRLVVIGALDGTGPMRLKCKCDCGIECNKLYRSMNAGLTTSCGCAMRDHLRSLADSRRYNYNLFGVRVTISELASLSGRSIDTIRSRINRGMTTEAAAFGHIGHKRLGSRERKR